MNILIEGWRSINHSYALVNQWQIYELIKSSNISFKDISFSDKNWNSQRNDSGLRDNIKNIINKIPQPSDDIHYDITYRISAPFNFDKKFKSKVVFVFATSEYKNDLTKSNFINGDPIQLGKEKKFFIHTPSNWSKKSFLAAGFREDQVVVVPHGVDVETFYLISEDKKKIIRDKYKINSEDFVLTNIGAMTQNKGVEDLIAAYGILKKKNKNLKLILKDQSNLYGRNANNPIKNMHDSKFNERYKIFNDQMYNDIIIISKNLNFNELRDIYSITDCYVSPYKAEGFNLTPLEAAACGTQIMVTDGGPTNDYFDDCMGFKIESEEKNLDNVIYLSPKINSLIEILDSTMNKIDKKKNIRSKFVHKNFSWENIVKKLKKEFENKLSK
ncbi:glycosyltransferase [Candidatus Pelagibacter sp.]|uniref:glycosyltransferase n=1 Tax=Candidatus Pelagibacter sp. TaxID=2024849 RepID=UPI003F84F159